MLARRGVLLLSPIRSVENGGGLSTDLGSWRVVMSAIAQERVFRSPRLKLVKFFQKSRDKWKAKCQAAKGHSKRLGNQLRAVEKSRAMWRQRAEQSERKLAALQAELDQSKKICKMRVSRSRLMPKHG